MDEKQARGENCNPAESPRNPKDNEPKGGHFQPDTLRADFTYWAKFKKWTESEACALLCGLNPYHAGKKWRISHGQAAEYDGLLKLAYSATNDRRFGWPYTPTRWLAWAKKYDLPMPPALQAEIIRWSDASSAGSVVTGCEDNTIETNVDGELYTKGEKPTPKQVEIIRTIKELWPKSAYPADVGVRNKKIQERYKEKELPPPGDTNIWKAFKFLE